MTVRRWTPPLAWAAVVLTLSSIPSSGLPSVDEGDKLAHFAMYALLGWLTVRAAWGGDSSWGTVALVIAALAVFGAVDEWHQRFIPGRSPERGDWVANVLGATAGSAAAALARRRREQTA